MKTLPEIEAAVELLPKDKQEELLRFIEARLRKGATASRQPAPWAAANEAFRSPRVACRSLQQT